MMMSALAAEVEQASVAIACNLRKEFTCWNARSHGRQGPSKALCLKHFASQADPSLTLTDRHGSCQESAAHVNVMQGLISSLDDVQQRLQPKSPR